MTWTVYQYSEPELTSLANQAKEQLLFALSNEGLLKGDPHQIAREYAIVIHKKGWLGQLWDKWRGTDRDGAFFAVLKSVSTGVPSGDGEKEARPRPTHLRSVPSPVFGNKEAE